VPDAAEGGAVDAMKRAIVANGADPVVAAGQPPRRPGGSDVGP
jgi:hypothetical protein